MYFHKKISSDIFLLVLVVVRLRLDSDIGLLNDRSFREPETREVFLGSSSAYTQITFHSPYSNIHYPHPKSIDYSDQVILFNRLNYFNTVSERRRNLIAYYASSPAASTNSNAEAAGEGDTPAGEADLDSACQQDPSTNQDLSLEDMNLIEILWKQDIDLGVSREAYDTRQCVEVDKLKDCKENFQEFHALGDPKECEERESSSNPYPGLNYTVDSETGEFVLGELTEDDISSNQLIASNPLPALNHDSYLPFNDDEAQMSNFSDVLPPSNFFDLLPDSECLLSEIEDIEKELKSFIENDPESEAVYSQPEDVFSNIDDCWPDSTTMLPLLSLGRDHQNPFIPFSSLPEPAFRSSNSIHPLSHSRSNEDFTAILHSSSLEASSSLEEDFHPIPASLGASSVGCALAESLATLHNDTDPIPSSSLLNSVYNPDIPELLYSNQSVSIPHNELLIQNLLTDDELQLATISEGNERILSEDTSSDTASLASGRVPSVSDCHDWVDSCSESSSHHGENRAYSFVPHTPRKSTIGYNQSTEFFHSRISPKHHRHLETNDSVNQEFSGASFEHSSENFPIKSEYYDCYENNASENQLSTFRKFDYYSNRLSGGNNILQHNHSYHLPFSSNDSHYKPVFRDKSKSSEDDDSCNKDEKKAKELKIPISIDDIINLAIEEYNERLSKYELTDQQLNLIRDIRRRGKNKVAAQNCRKRKMDQISNLQQDLDALQNEKMKLKSKQSHLLQEKHNIEDKYTELFQIVSQFTNYKPPEISNSHPTHSNQLAVPIPPDIILSDDDSDFSRGARTKRKFRK